MRIQMIIFTSKEELTEIVSLVSITNKNLFEIFWKCFLSSESLESSVSIQNEYVTSLADPLLISEPTCRGLLKIRYLFKRFYWKK